MISIFQWNHQQNNNPDIINNIYQIRDKILINIRNIDLNYNFYNSNNFKQHNYHYLFHNYYLYTLHNLINQYSYNNNLHIFSKFHLLRNILLDNFEHKMLHLYFIQCIRNNLSNNDDKGLHQYTQHSIRNNHGRYNYDHMYS